MSEETHAHQSHALNVDTLHGLGPDSYTTQRLKHATPEHLHLTTRRCFIGPIPEGWLKSHRRDWYKHHLGIHYSSRAATFSASEGTGRQRRLTGLEPGPSVTVQHGLSFPQPASLENEDNIDEESDGLLDVEEDAAVVTDAPPALDASRSRNFSKGAGVKDNSYEEEYANAQAEGSSSVEKDEQEDDGNTSEDSVETIVPIKGKQSSVDSPSMSARLALRKPNGDSSGRGKKRIDMPERKGSELTGTSASFVTANESLGRSEEDDGEEAKAGPEQIEAEGHSGNDTSRLTVSASPSLPGSPHILPGVNSPQRNPSAVDSYSGTLRGASLGALSSRASLLPHADGAQERKSKPSTTSPDTQATSKANATVPYSKSSLKSSNQDRQPRNDNTNEAPATVRFGLPEDEEIKRRDVKLRLAQLRQRRTMKRIQKGHAHDGEVIKMENMLVRVEFTLHDMPPDYDENDSLKVESRVLEKWKEYMIVCRESADEDAPYILQMYKSRVIPAVEKARSRKACAHEIPLDKKVAKVNLFSSLDKTMVVWVPYRKGTLIYILQAKSGADSMEWYTFVRNVLGWNRTQVLQVNVPDLNVNLRLDNPFEKLESTRDIVSAAKGDDEAVLRTMEEEQAVASNIVGRCMEMLKKSGEWRDILDSWAGHERIGLAWKRYDRLEWVHGANEQRMYGTMAMEKSHELELRPKQHYPTTVKNKKGDPLTEPPPVEGFLIRLTSQRGTDQKFGKLFFKRLYFSSHDNYLVFNRPAKSDPPPPPKMPLQQDAEVPTAAQISEQIPLIYSVNPFPVREGELTWLASSKEDIAQHDRDAYDEYIRRIDLLLNCDGLVNLCNVVKVRNVHRGATLADENVDAGSDVDFDQSVDDSRTDDGVTTSFDDQRTFELLLRNGLVVRLQAFDGVTKREWMVRLRSLIKYWKLRTAGDIALYRSVRAQNLAQLSIDEDAEAYIGQFGRKWEVTHSFASAQLHHVCAVGDCRTPTLAGSLYRKPRARGTFERCLVLLAHGRLLVFQDGLRSASGSLRAHTHHDRVAALDLRDCYVYSGLVTAGDLLTERSHGAGSRPGHDGLPKMYLDDGWSSTDESAMTCFVVWTGHRKSWFRSVDAHEGRGTEGKKQKLKLVSTLGVPGRSAVFMARSRAERDHWVMSIHMEISRLGQRHDVRLTGAIKE